MFSLGAVDPDWLGIIDSDLEYVGLETKVLTSAGGSCSVNKSYTL